MEGPGKTLDDLVPAHLPYALRFATRLTGDRDAAEEIVQDALVRAARSWRTFRGESEFRTWLLRIVINAFRDRAAQRSPPQTLPEEIGDPRSVDPPAAAMEAELGRLIALRIARLPRRQREVLVLVAYEGLAPREVAGLLGISESNVHATLHVARERLRRELAPYLLER
jgi:RNA polymerase sigma-70 factor (ECF subfamily)